MSAFIEGKGLSKVLFPCFSAHDCSAQIVVAGAYEGMDEIGAAKAWRRGQSKPSVTAVFAQDREGEMKRLTVSFTRLVDASEEPRDTRYQSQPGKGLEVQRSVQCRGYEKMRDTPYAKGMKTAERLPYHKVWSELLHP